MKNGKVSIIELGWLFAPKSKKTMSKIIRNPGPKKTSFFDVNGLPNGTKTPPEINAKNV